MKFTSYIAASHRLLENVGSAVQHPLLLLIRLYWGYDFVQTGWGKLNNLERTAEFFASLNIPLPMFNAAAAGATELICGGLLMVGLASRAASLPLIIILSIAYATDDREALLGIFTDPESFIAAVPFNHLLAALVVFAFGAGHLSVDRLVRRTLSPRS